MTRSATLIWCPECNELGPCKSLNLSESEETGVYIDEGERRHLYKTNHEDIRWSRRLRLCEKCGEGFLTGEIHEKLIDELAEIRDSLEKVITAFDSYKEVQQEASKTLSKLTRAIGNVKK